MNFKKFLSILVVAFLVVLTTSCAPTGGGGISSENYRFTTPQTNKLKLTADWEGKDFITSGIGAVKLKQNVDGDTTIFGGNAGGRFTVRYLGVNTPESTYKVEPWGFTASNFTKEKLNNAETIVLEADEGKERTDSNGRYLAWVWYRTSPTSDFRLLNLELVEYALSRAEATNTKYNNVFNPAEINVKQNKIRIWGEVDKTFDDSKVGESFTIKELRDNFSTLNVGEQDSYKGKVIRTTGVVTRQAGVGSAYIQSYDEATKAYYNIYVFGGYDESILKFGREVFIQGKIGYFNGALQITDLDRNNSGILSFADDPVNPSNVHMVEFNGEMYQSANDNLQGQLVHLTNLNVKSYRNSLGPDGLPNKGFTLVVTDQSGIEMELRVDKNTYIKILGENSDVRITSGEFFMGRVIKDVKCVVGFFSNVNKEGTEYYADGIQLVLLAGSDISLEPLK